jgi:hypothetical protein
MAFDLVATDLKLDELANQRQASTPLREHLGAASRERGANATRRRALGLAVPPCGAQR